MSQDQSEFNFSLETGEIKNEDVKVLTVSGLNAMIKNNLESQFPLLWLRGELSNFKPHTSGHLYFSLKDSTSQISAVMFRGYTRQLNFKPKDGLEVLIRGRVSVYEPRGSYQLYVESMEPMGAGALQKAFEDLKIKLQKEGLFALDHKKPLPFLPKKIAVITSSTGVAVRDMIQVLGRRFKAAEVLVFPVLTQGQGSAESLAAAVKQMDQMNFDVAIIGRGGGSIEDLWSFNDEALARTIYACKTPIVSAVGHEIDFTICDFVSDVRAPTPSAAAELVTKNVDVIKDNLSKYQQKLRQLLGFKLKTLSSQLLMYRRSLVDPKKRLADLRMKCDDWLERLIQRQNILINNKHKDLKSKSDRLIRNKDFVQNTRQKTLRLTDRLNPSFVNAFERKKNKFLSVVELLDSLSPLSVMHRGYSIVRSESKEGKILTDVSQLKVKDQVWIKLLKSSFKAEVKEIES
jgi:exodeoxyribonuclease VII large subunit